MQNNGSLVKTPALGVNGTVKLSFKYAATAGNYADLSLQMDDGLGTIQAYTAPLHILKTDGFKEATFTINDVSPNSKIIFSAESSDNSVGIDDVVISVVGDIPSINLYQDNSNETTLNSYNGMFVDVSTDRTLLPNVCHTMCLPFDMNRAKMIAAVGSDQNPLMYTFTGLTDEGNMSFTEIGDGTITAGTPFLLKVEKGFDDLKFYAVKITATTPTDVVYGSVTFKGTFNPTNLATDGSELFLGTDNYLYTPASGTKPLGGLRAYINKSTTARLGITFQDEAAAIHEATAPVADSPLYNLQGQRIVKPRTKSLYIKNRKKMIQK